MKTPSGFLSWMSNRVHVTNMIIREQDDIWKNASAVLQDMPEPERCEFYGQSDFECPPDEESLYIVSAKKAECPELFQFWIVAYRQIFYPGIDFDPKTDHSGLFRTNIWEVDLQKFREDLHVHIHSLRKEVNLPENPRRAYQVEDSWNEKIWILEDDSGFFLVKWETCA